MGKEGEKGEDERPIVATSPLWLQKAVTGAGSLQQCYSEGQSGVRKELVQEGRQGTPSIINKPCCRKTTKKVS